MSGEHMTLAMAARRFPTVPYYVWRAAVREGRLPAERAGDAPHSPYRISRAVAEQFAQQVESTLPPRRRPRAKGQPASPATTIAVAQLLRRLGGHSLKPDEMTNLSWALAPFVTRP